MWTSPELQIVTTSTLAHQLFKIVQMCGFQHVPTCFARYGTDSGSAKARATT